MAAESDDVVLSSGEDDVVLSPNSMDRSTVTPEREGVTAGKRKRSVESDVRDHFERKRVANEEKIFTYCSNSYAGKNSTTSLRTHLKQHHPGKLDHKPKTGAAVPDWCKATDETAVRKMAADDQVSLDKKLRRWIVSSNQPFSCVDCPEFRELVARMNPSYQIGTRNTVKKAILADYDAYKSCMIEELKDAPGRISITLDGWNSMQQIAYMVLTAHWINREWKLERAVLDFTGLPASHTGENLEEVVFEALKEFGLLDLLLGYTADGAGNIRRCFELMQTKRRAARILQGKGSEVREFRVWCLSHCFNLVAGIALKSKAKVVESIHAMITFLRRPKAKKLFLEFLKEDHMKLPTNTETRWNSTLEMLRGALNRRYKLDQFIGMQESTIATKVLSEGEWGEVSDLIDLLTPFETATDESSASITPTVHLGVLAVQVIKDHLVSVKADLGKKQWIGTMADDMLTKLNDVIGDNWDLDLLVMTAALDPCMKLAGLPQEKADQAKSTLKRVMEMYQAAAKEFPAVRQDPGPDLGTPSRGILALRAKRMALVAQAAASEDEVDLYLREGPNPAAADPLLYWKQNAARFPVLSKIARHFLAVQAPSVESEREFSKAGDVTSKRRTSLGVVGARATMCLKSWYKRNPV